MTEGSLKDKTLTGLFWNGVDKFAYNIILFTINIIMARLLSPTDYGLVGIMIVFITFSAILVDGGFVTALIQKKDRCEADFNTVYIINIITSVLVYLLLFGLSPVIARFYKEPSLVLLLRVLSLQLIISAFMSVPLTKLTIEIKFKKIAFTSITSAVISGIIGITLAFRGFGVWSLVAQQLILLFIKCILLNLVQQWKPVLRFSIQSCKKLFSFSSKLIASSFIDQIYLNLYPLIIGKYFSPRTLGIYTRGEQFGKLPVVLLSDIFIKVTLPIMSSIQDDVEKLRKLYREYIQASSFIIFAVMMWLFVIAKPLVLLLLTEKWVEAVPVMQILCLAMMTLHISAINRNLLYVKGRSDLALKLEIIKKVSVIIIFFVSINFGLIGVCIGQLVYGLYAPTLNSYYTKDLIGVRYWEQFIDYGKFMFIAVVSALVPFFLVYHFSSREAQLIIPSILYFTLYLSINAVCKTHPYQLMVPILKKMVRR